ncbi:Mitochondrial zinc maintenance protein 1, mitochondrial [Yamadazyma tenuis]|uniref:Mitochondrial zinc maintenance protein 1, mitochondrial n=1 Tax=Candida tenuis (strain ATCC 10573 / BCRC 21748 / CBS 615 / JCM 9827 / NBRC 10315 / NRRL Y-1498 / VKM Y-70) TaxID=590646 RepID=G3B744_CANTC|nr:uncharacterized protein CANTEDRAFT_114405 [Yamadazyma tenuis ATCC 10573]EGV63094.1 hypothetical protein CANTEDRAFT_114405 [Yamadazyma tenuis ATCC 10573]WEJ97091.1 Mitochondrial zinc maintenance protein 1, mitochondrial [Yamadazyma tenuis]
MKNPALQAYRTALRATAQAFKGDLEIKLAARSKIREGMHQHQTLQSPQRDEEIDKLNEVSMFLKKNIVQGQKQDDGKYLLNFTKETELGDNDSIKQSKQDMGSLAGKKGANIKKCS